MGFISCDIMVMHFNKLSFIGRLGNSFGGKYLPAPGTNFFKGPLAGEGKIFRSASSFRTTRPRHPIQRNKKPKKRNIKHPLRVKEQ